VFKCFTPEERSSGTNLIGVWVRHKADLDTLQKRKNLLALLAIEQLMGAKTARI
jgi:hypothetical protein